MPELDERPDPMELTERCAAGLEERLGRDHQKAHGSMIFSRIRSTLCRRRTTSSMPEEQPPPSSARRYGLMAVKFAVSALLLTLLFSRIDVNQLWAGARGA